MRQTLEMALKFIERVNKEGWILADFEPEMYKVINAIKETLAQPEQEPVAMLERDPSIGRLRVTYEDAVTELDEGVYPLYTKPQGWRDNVAQAYLKGFDEASSQHGCAECGIGGGHALYCVKCAEVALNTWVGLTDEETRGCIEATIEITDPLLLDAVNAVIVDVERLLREKNI